MSPAKRLTPTQLKALPNLKRADYSVTSDQTPFSGTVNRPYNCIAWAAEENARWWWPGNTNCYWPPSIQSICTLDAFVAAFGTLRYKKCANGNPEPNMEKVAIYVDATGLPTHMARQLPSGRWTSKLGEWEDIEHRNPLVLEGVGPERYGTVGQYLRRQIAKQVPPP